VKAATKIAYRAGMGWGNFLNEGGKGGDGSAVSERFSEAQADAAEGGVVVEVADLDELGEAWGERASKCGKEGVTGT
jgi:hypothetical protein